MNVNFIIAPAFSKVRYRGSTFRPFVRSFVRSSVRPSVRPQFASSLENLRRVWEYTSFLCSSGSCEDETLHSNCP